MSDEASAFGVGMVLGIVIGVLLGYFIGINIDQTNTDDELVKNIRDIKVRVTEGEFGSEGTKISLSIKYSGDERVDFDWRQAVIIIDEMQYPARGAEELDPVIYGGAATEGHISFPAVDEGKFRLNISLDHHGYSSNPTIFTFEIDPEEIMR